MHTKFYDYSAFVSPVFVHDSSSEGPLKQVQRKPFALIRPHELNSLFIVSKFPILHEGGRSFFTIHYKTVSLNLLITIETIR